MMKQAQAPRYGHRHEIVHNIQGSPFNQDTPLRREDFLDPLPGDVFYHGVIHDQVLAHVRDSLHRLLRANPVITVLSQVKLQLPAPATLHPMPDLLLAKNLQSPTRTRAVFDIAQEGVTPAAIIEITSPFFVKYDLNAKVQLYAAAGIPEYIILDTGLRAPTSVAHQSPGDETPAPCILAYRLQDGDSTRVYAPVEPDDRGCIASRALGTRLGTTETGFAVFDPATDAPIQPAAEDAETLSSSQAEGRFRAQSIASQLKL